MVDLKNYTKEEIRQKEKDKYDKSYFENEYWREDIPGYESSTGYSYNDPDHSRRFTLMADILEELAFNSILDVGCGKGILVKKLTKRGYDVKGTEVSEYVIRNYLSELHSDRIINQASLRNLPFDNNSFDIVFCSDVLEHVPFFDVKQSISELVRVVNGIIVATINIDNPYKYHPTILSRDTWNYLFLQEGADILEDVRHNIQTKMDEHRPEYDFFVFKVPQQ
jgi:2-polyprenyl-3-methyl-5-hydroxy-6-metoxy-1,4-benzoquinol methylase